MSSRLPTRRNVEPLLRIVSQLFAGQSDLTCSTSTETMADYYHVPTDNVKRDPAKEQQKHSRLPVRRTARRKPQEPHENTHKTHSGTVVGRSKSVDDLSSAYHDIGYEEEKQIPYTDRGQLEKLLHSKDQQIAKLVEKLSAVFESNNQFAAEHEKLQKDYQQAVRNLHTLETIKAKSCDQCISFETERNQLVNENADLRNDVKMMKILVYRLNVQIERYQDAVREGTNAKSAIPRLDFVDSTYGGTKDNLNWGPVNSHTLGPLLNAYEETIAEKSDLVQHYESELVGFTGKLKKVLDENETLQQEMELMRTAQNSWTSERTRLQAQVEVLRSKADVQGKRADLAKEKLVEVLKCYEQKVQAQCLDIQRLQEAYSRSKGELTTLRNVSQNPDVVANSLKECQQVLEQLRLQRSNDQTRSVEETNTIKQDLANKSTELEHLREDYQQQLKIFERQKEINEILMGKNGALKRTLERTRQSKEILKQRLKTMISWGKGSEQRKDQLQESWNTIRALQGQLQQRDAQFRSLQHRYQVEVEQLQRRLRQREDTVRKILADKAQFHRQA